ncbi:N-acetylmuramoyl-L-alanine amidase [Alkalibacillus sp. S2W]|uniref:peptidoglycan recognition protein family protein n=1 Tax=Alkalibacillus sp. S2W TaxID=3386553 RepID=UPI00398C93CB
MVQDLRGKTMGGHSKRSLDQVNFIVRHHSATEEGDVFKFEDYWKSKGWQTGGYHEVILRDGDFQLNYDENVITNGVGGHNTESYHICLVGNGDFTEAQEKTFKKRAKRAMEVFDLNVNDVIGHREFKSARTSCPGINMDNVRQTLKNENKPEQANAIHIATDGWWGEETTEALQMYLSTVVDGVISDQYRNDVTGKIVSGITFGKGGSLVIRALQKVIDATVDGYLGTNTIEALQQHLGTVVDGKLSEPSLVVETLQRALNEGSL